MTSICTLEMCKYTQKFLFCHYLRTLKQKPVYVTVKSENVQVAPFDKTKVDGDQKPCYFPILLCVSLLNCFVRNKPIFITYVQIWNIHST